jgi:hypothetical protein
MSIVLNASKQALISMAAAGFSLVGVDSKTTLVPFLFFTSWHLAKKVTLHNTCLGSDIPKEICNFIFYTFLIIFMFNLWSFWSTSLAFNISAAARVSTDLMKFLTDTTSNLLYYFNQQLIDIMQLGTFQKGAAAKELISDLQLMYQNGLGEIVSFSLAAAAMLSGKMELVRNISDTLKDLAKVEVPIVDKAKGLFSSISEKFSDITGLFKQSGDEIIVTDDEFSKALVIYQNVDRIPPHAIQEFAVNQVQNLIVSLDATIVGDMSRAIDIMSSNGDLIDAIASSEEQTKGITDEDNMFVRYYKNFKYLMDPNAIPLLVTSIPNLVETMFDKFTDAINDSPYNSFKRMINTPQFKILKESTVRRAEETIDNAKISIAKSKYDVAKAIEFQQSYGLGSGLALPLATVSGAVLNQPDIEIGVSFANVFVVLFIFAWFALVCSRKGKKDERRMRELELEDRKEQANLLQLDIPEQPQEIFVRMNQPLLELQHLPEAPRSFIGPRIRRRRPKPEEMEEGEILDSDVEYYD